MIKTEKPFSSLTLPLLILAPSLIAVFYFSLYTEIHSQVTAKATNMLINMMHLILLLSYFAKDYSNFNTYFSYSKDIDRKDR